MRNSQVGNPVENARRRFTVRHYCFQAWNPETRKYLHLSGSGETNRVTYAWSGTQAQFECLKARSKDTEAVPLGRYRLISIKSLGEHAMEFKSQKENLEDFFNEQ